MLDSPPIAPKKNLEPCREVISFALADINQPAASLKKRVPVLSLRHQDNLPGRYLVLPLQTAHFCQVVRLLYDVFEMSPWQLAKSPVCLRILSVWPGVFGVLQFRGHTPMVNDAHQLLPWHDRPVGLDLNPEATTLETFQ